MRQTKLRRLGVITALSTALVALAASVAVADQTTTINPANAPSGTHFQTGTATCTVNPTTLAVSCSTFELAGVGHTNANVRLSADYAAIVDCFNPGNNPNNPIESHTTSFSATSTITVSSLKNGRLTIPSRSVSPATGLSSQSCPNPNWTPVIRPGSLELVSFTYTVTFDGFTGAYITITGNDP
jgi:hypothetical protein